MNHLLGCVTLTATGLLAAQNSDALALGPEQGYTAFDTTQEGIPLTATATSIDGTTDYFAYVDGGFSGRPGGLGVCKELTASFQCVDPADDNLGLNEMLILTFDRLVTIVRIDFLNAIHLPDFAEEEDFSLSIDGGDFTTYPLTPTFSGSLTGTEFRFIAAENDSDRLYITDLPLARPSSIPEPLTLHLFTAGLAGLAWTLRRKWAIAS